MTAVSAANGPFAATRDHNHDQGWSWQNCIKVATLFPVFGEVGVEEMIDGQRAASTDGSPSAYYLLARRGIGLQPDSIDETLRFTADSYTRLGLLTL